MNIITKTEDIMTYINGLDSKNTTYHIIYSLELINGEKVIMYGIEGKLDEEVVFLSSLSDNKKRIQNLIDRMNYVNFPLDFLSSVVENFFEQ